MAKQKLIIPEWASYMAKSLKRLESRKRNKYSFVDLTEIEISKDLMQAAARHKKKSINQFKTSITGKEVAIKKVK